MKRDPVLEGRRWLEQAEADRIGAQLLFDGGSFHLACFVGQQIAEKTINAFIYSQGEDFVVGHSVEVLCRWASEFDSDFKKLREKIAPLDAYYIPTRYPNGLPDSIPAKVYTKDVASEVLKLADLALELVRKKFNKEK
jgi:HEPN domain-containing protein